MKKLVDQGEELKIVGIVQASEDANASALTPGIGYPQRLTEHVAKEAAKSEIVKDQLKNPSKNVFTGDRSGRQKRRMDWMRTACLRSMRMHFRKHLVLIQCTFRWIFR